MRGSESQTTLREKFDNYLRLNNKRRTAERFAILDMAYKMAGHFTAEDIAALLRNEGFPISNATIYSTLSLLVDFGLIMRQRFGNKACIYEKASHSASSTHHHLICTSCGKVKEVRDQAFSRLIEGRRFAGFSQSYYSLYIYGTCSACARKKNKESKVK